MSSRDAVSSRPLLDKLGVKPNSSVAFVGEFPDWFRVLVMTRAAAFTDGVPSHAVDIAFLAADSVDDLRGLDELRRLIAPSGAVWVVSRKGKQATLRDVEIIAAALEAGLVDNKVVSFSDTHTSLRLVIRLRDRGSTQPA